MRSYPFTSQVTYDDEGLPLYDRAIDSAFLRKVFSQYFSDGVFYKPSNALQVVVDSGMQVAVEPGCCHIQGAIGIEDSRRTLVVQASESLDRIDTVVARLDLSLAVRDIDLYVVKGTAAVSPQPPALTRDATVWELGLANLFVAKNTQTISQQRITDTRLDASRCGVVAQTIGELDTSPYFAQIQAALADIQQQAAAQLVRLEFDFDSWLDTLKGKLGDDPATALQAQVDDLQATAGGMPLELSAGSNSIQITADENRLESVKVAGFTTQTGSGDPSKDNVRPIQNAGTRNKLMTVTGDAEGLFMSTIIANKAVVFVKDAMPTQSPLCDRYRSNSATATDKTCWIDQNRNFGVTDSRFTSLEEAKRILNEEPVTFAYQSTQDTGEYYTGVAVEQDGVYHCDIIRLADRLHAGDTLETRAETEWDAYAEFDGSSDEAWAIDSGSVAGSGGSKRLWVRLPGPQAENTANAAVPNAASNQLIPRSAEDTYAAKCEKCFDVIYSGSVNMLHVRIAGISTVEALKTHLQSHPLRVFYKSASGGAGLQAKQEKHARTTLVLDGGDNKFTKSGSYWNLPFSMPDANQSPNAQCSFMPGNLFHADSTYAILFLREQDTPSYFASVDECNTFLAQQYAAGTPCVIEYDLASPEVYADAPVQLENPQGASTVSNEESTTLTVYIRSTKELQPLTVSLNGANQGQYNGETKQDINLVVTPQSIGALPKVKYAEYKFPDQQVPAQGGTLFEVTQAAMGIPDNGRVVSIHVENTGWTGIVPQHWSPIIGAKKVYVLLYNTTQTARTVGPIILVFYYEE